MFSKQFEYFISVAKHGSIGKAAQEIYRTTPTVSVQIANLENELGFQLFKRSSKGVEPTAAGAYLLEQLHEISEIGDRAIKEARRIATQSIDRIMIGVISSDAYQIIPTVLKAYSQRKIKDFELHLMPVEKEAVSIKLKNREIDACFVFGYDLFQENGIIHHALIKDKLICAIPLHHKLHTLKEISLNDIRSESLVIVEKGTSPFHDRLIEYILEHYPGIKLKYISGSIPMGEIFFRSPESENSIFVCGSMNARVDSRYMFLPFISPFEDSPRINVGILCRDEPNPVLDRFEILVRDAFEEL